MLALTPPQARLFWFYADYIRDNQFPPTITQVAQALGYAGCSSIASAIAAVQRKGYMRFQPGRARAVAILQYPSEATRPQVMA